jgi:hypothetical protein
MGWSLVRRGPTECGVSECDREAWIIRRPWHTRLSRNKKVIYILLVFNICIYTYIFIYTLVFEYIYIEKYILIFIYRLVF